MWKRSNTILKVPNRKEEPGGQGVEINEIRAGQKKIKGTNSFWEQKLFCREKHPSAS